MKNHKDILAARNSSMVHRHDDSLILRTAAIIILPLQLVFSVFLLLRGHDEPGGGFIGGLVASGAFSLYLFTFGIRALNRLLGLAQRHFVCWIVTRISGHSAFTINGTGILYRTLV